MARSITEPPKVGDRVEILEDGPHVGKRGRIVHIEDGEGETTTDFTIICDDGERVVLWLYPCAGFIGDLRKIL